VGRGRPIHPLNGSFAPIPIEVRFTLGGDLEQRFDASVAADDAKQ
jgi:hypothetical protein